MNYFMNSILGAIDACRCYVRKLVLSMAFSPSGWHTYLYALCFYCGYSTHLTFRVWFWTCTLYLHNVHVLNVMYLLIMHNLAVSSLSSCVRCVSSIGAAIWWATASQQLLLCWEKAFTFQAPLSKLQQPYTAVLYARSKVCAMYMFSCVEVYLEGGMHRDFSPLRLTLPEFLKWIVLKYCQERD